MFKWEDGNKYEGSWARGLLNGEGKLTYANKDCYEGEFEDGKRHGEGKMFFFKKKMTYEGPWIFGKQHGIGTISDLEGKKRSVLYSNGKFVKWIKVEKKPDHFNEMSSSLMR